MIFEGASGFLASGGCQPYNKDQRVVQLSRRTLISTCYTYLESKVKFMDTEGLRIESYYLSYSGYATYIDEPIEEIIPTEA